MEGSPEDSPPRAGFVLLFVYTLRLYAYAKGAYSLLLPPVVLDPRREVGGAHRGTQRAGAETSMSCPSDSIIVVGGLQMPGR